MFLLDDLLVRPFVSLLEVIQSMAIEEMYDIEQIHDEIKENQLLYEVGERPQEEYERRREELEEELRLAEQARETMSGKVEIKR